MNRENCDVEGLEAPELRRQTDKAATMLHHHPMSTNLYGARTEAEVNTIIIWVAEGFGLGVPPLGQTQ